MTWWAANLWETSPVLLVSWVFWVIASITLHELAHGWTAIRHGDDTPIHTGHMTVNPIVHMGPMSLIMFALIGIAWGAMPVDPSRLKGKHADAMVAAAGPVMNLGLAALCAVLLVAVERALPEVGVSDDITDRLALFFFAGGVLNIMLAILNMLPIPPLDGSRIAASFSRRYVDFVTSPAGQGIMFISMAIVFLAAGRVLMVVGAEAFRAAIDLLENLISPPPPFWPTTP